MKINKVVILLSLILSSLIGQSQDSASCYEAYDLFSNQGIAIKNDCSGKQYVQCLYKSGNIYEIIAAKRYHNDSEYIKDRIIIKKSGTQTFYCFEKSRMPGPERLPIRIFPGKKDKWYDTIMVKKDTIYTKSLWDYSVILSKCFRLNNDTFRLESYHFEFLTRRGARRSSLEKYANNSDTTDNLGYVTINFTLNKDKIHFLNYYSTFKDFSSPYDISGYNRIEEYLKVLNTEEKDMNVFGSFFWLYIAYRFIML